MTNSTGKLIRRVLTPAFVTSLIYFLRFGAKISPKAEVELSPNLKFGRGAAIGSFTKMKATEGLMEFGQRCGIATGCFFTAGAKGLLVGDNFVCGPNVVITSSNYKYDQFGVHLEDQGTTSKGIRIGDNVWIGAGSVILDGTTLADNCIVVANSLVNRRYPAGAVIQGNPAKIMFKRSQNQDQQVPVVTP